MPTRLSPRRRDLDAEHVSAELIRRTEVNGLSFSLIARHLPACSSIPSFSAKSFRSWPEAKCALRKVIVTGVSGVELLQHLVEQGLDEGGVHWNFADDDLDDLACLGRP